MKKGQTTEQFLRAATAPLRNTIGAKMPLTWALWELRARWRHAIVAEVEAAVLKKDRKECHERHSDIVDSVYRKDWTPKP